MTENSTDKVTNNTPPFKDGSSSFGSFYPKHYVLAVFNSDAEAATAGEQLRAGGFVADDVIVASGHAIADHAQAAKSEQGLLSKLGEQWSRLYTDESSDARALIEFAKRGAAFVLAYAPDDVQTQKAVSVLRALHPSVFRKYDTLTISELG